MNWKNLPTLNSLKAFAAVADTGGYSQAGVALNVTHAAVIQQVRSLESHLGVSLVVRDGRGISLTQEGEALAREVMAGFATIHRGVENLSSVDKDRPIQITMSPAFAVSWLMPRLIDFQSRYPHITLMLNPTSEIMELKPGGIDLAIRYRATQGGDSNTDNVMIADMVIVAAPSVIAGSMISHAADLIDLPWLQELGTNEVAQWMASHGVDLDRPMSISHMPGNLIMDSVRRGDGITYTARPFVDKEIQSGELVELFCDPALGQYYIKTRPGILRPSAKAFVSWLKEQAAKDLE